MARDHKVRFGAIVAVAVCTAAHANADPVRENPLVSSPQPRPDSWLGSALSCARECTPADEAASAERIPTDLARLISSKRVVTIKARLFPAVADCLLGSGRGGCGFEWVLAPRTDCPDWKLAVRRDPEFLRRQAIDVECAGDSGTAGTEVIVKGRLQEAGDKILATDLCRVRTDAVRPVLPVASRSPPCPRLVPRQVPRPQRPLPPPAARSDTELL